MKVTDERVVKDVYVPRDKDGGAGTSIFVEGGWQTSARGANLIEAVSGMSTGICKIIVFYLKPQVPRFLRP